MLCYVFPAWGAQPTAGDLTMQLTPAEGPSQGGPMSGGC